MQRDVGGVEFKLARFLVLRRGQRFGNLAVFDDVILLRPGGFVFATREHAHGLRRVRLGDHLGARLAFALDAAPHKSWIADLHQGVIHTVRVHVFDLPLPHVRDDAFARHRGVNTAVAVGRLGDFAERFQYDFPIFGEARQRALLEEHHVSSI